MFHPSCVVSDIFSFSFETKKHWYLPSMVSSTEQCTVWCFTVEWPNIHTARSNISSAEVQKDGKVILQIGFDSKSEAKEWQEQIRSNISALSSRLFNASKQRSICLS